MKEMSWIDRVINFIKDIFCKDSKTKSNNLKKKMCESAKNSNICSMDCEICAWNTGD